jgi:hypothetical protein
VDAIEEEFRREPVRVTVHLLLTRDQDARFNQLAEEKNLDYSTFVRSLVLDALIARSRR